jgi:[ribosomal protein S5]-alanine N-acetyltransferase
MKEEKDYKVYLRAFEIIDIEKLNELRNDDEAFLYTGGNKFYISTEYDRKWVEDKIFNNQHQIYLAICLTNTKELIGYLGINEIDYRNRKAQWAGINIDKSHSNKGYATEAARLMLKFAFEELGLNRFYGYWLESNCPSIRMAEKLGFVVEGLVRGFVYKRNQFQNAYLMSILKEEYNTKLNER